MASHRAACMSLLLLGSLLMTASKAQQATAQPPPYRTIIPLTVVPYPCLSVPAQGARILLSKADLAAISASDAQDSQKDRKQRLAFLAIGRARKLLEKASAEDDLGCAAVSLDHTLEDSDSLFLVGSLLEEGKAAVVRSGSHTPEAKILMEDYGEGASVERFRLVDGTVFFSLTLWVSELNTWPAPPAGGQAREM